MSEQKLKYELELCQVDFLLKVMERVAIKGSEAATLLLQTRNLLWAGVPEEMKKKPEEEKEEPK